VARYKVLQSVAHSVGHSFTSHMNWDDDDYVMGHLLVRMVVTGEDAFRLDLVSGRAEPRVVLTGPIRRASEAYVARFRELVRSHGTDLRYVRSADLEVRYDLARLGTRPNGAPNGRYECVSSVVDDRGREYRWESTGTWYPEVWEPPSRWTRGWHRLRRRLGRIVSRGRP
jgi:hypothetical protein